MSEGSGTSLAGHNSGPHDKTKAMLSFPFAKECELELHCSPFGVSGLYLRIKDVESVGIGTSMSRITGTSAGSLLYNDPRDLVDAKYKLYGMVEEDNVLRIDFVRIFAYIKEKDGAAGAQPHDTKDESGLQSQPQSQAQSPARPKVIGENPGDENYEMPDLVFRGDLPIARPDVVEPFIGVFNFENITTEKAVTN